MCTCCCRFSYIRSIHGIFSSVDFQCYFDGCIIELVKKSRKRGSGARRRSNMPFPRLVEWPLLIFELTSGWLNYLAFLRRIEVKEGRKKKPLKRKGCTTASSTTGKIGFFTLCAANVWRYLRQEFHRGKMYLYHRNQRLKQFGTQKPIKLRFDWVALLAFRLNKKASISSPEIVSIPRFLVVPILIISNPRTAISWKISSCPFQLCRCESLIVSCRRSCIHSVYKTMVNIILLFN